MTMISQRLHRARKAAGLSLRALADLVGVSHAAIKKYEDGEATPNSSALLALAKALGVRTEYFFRPTIPQLDGIQYRKRSGLPQKRQDAITAEILDQIERRLELEALFPHPPVKAFAVPGKLPERANDYAEIEHFGEGLRKAWNLGFDPIPDLVDVLESHGVRVFMVDANDEPKFDGLAATAGGMPLVVVGKRWPGDRQRFTLAHELGHLMLKDRLAPKLDEEKACNRFAGAFLLPEPALRLELGAKRRTRLELRELSLLKQEFGLSMQGILYRAFDLGILPESEFTSEMRSFRARGWRTTEPGEAYPPEKAHLFEQLVFHALAEDYIGESKAELLKMPLPEFRGLRALEPVDATADQ
jgi:Zn-dependent peptidase ImmA (M78 family)/transcriptional regulator with XRE-family HTH domain